MKYTSYRHILLLTALLAGTFTVLGCDTSGPEFLSGETTRVIEGILLAEEESDTDFFALTRSGTVNILAERIEGRRPETGEPIDAPILVVSIGAPNPADETVCQLTFSQTLSEGDSFSIYYGDGLYCLSVFRTLGSLDGAEYEYMLNLTGAFS